MIQVKDLHLHYSLLGCRETSLKAYLFKWMKLQRERPESFHALKGISLTIEKGERVGLIGHNGSGKTTLLRAIAGLYPISSGSCNIQGELRALFELSLGFEGEATGRENILYRGLLLGQHPKTIKLKEEQIIAFADIGSFIDFPIKTYSSGMLVRLAFSISTHLPGDILLIDEVIGAGDAAFTTKASSKLKDLISQAQILLLVSHDMAALKTFCSRLLVMHQGSLVFDGGIDEGLLYYHTMIEKNKTRSPLQVEEVFCEV